MQTTSILKAIPLSFYSSSFYREVGQKWKGQSFLYLLVLLAIAWFSVSFFFTRQLMPRANRIMDAMVHQMPTLHIERGVVTTTKPGVFYIRDPEDKKEMIIIDTYNQYSDFNKSSARVLVKRDSIWIKQGIHESSVYSFKKEWQGTIGPKELNAVFSQFKQYGGFIIFGLFFAIGLTVNYLVRILQGLFYGMIGWIFGRLSKTKIAYDATLRIALIAMTPAIIINTVFSWMVKVPVNLGWIGFIITVFYVYFGIRAMQDK